MTVHQLLFGYDQGHDLLASSVSLPPDARRRAVVLSDLSGSEPRPGFDGYLTGYPLPSVGAYALARTWYAPEMPRPGCVWTHTLLIAFSDLAALQDARSLLPLFARPSVPEGLNRYETPLPVVVSALPQRPLDTGLARGLLQALYGDLHRDSSPPPVVVVRPASEDGETAVLAIWDQQWPRLRRSFSFCTGALELRKVDEAFMSLQVTPQPPGGGAIRVVDTAAGQPTPFPGEPDKGWLSDALGDLALNEKSVFRQRLRLFGADVPGERWAFSALASSISLVASDLPPDEQIPRLGTLFPSPQDAGTLKTAVLGSRLGVDGPAAERDRLTLLLTTSHDLAFETLASGSDERVGELLRADRNEALTLLRDLFQSDPNPWGQQAIHRLVSAASATELFKALSDSDRGVQSLFERRPELLHEPKLWSGSRLLRDRAVAVLRERPNTDWAKVGEAMLDAGVDGYADTVEQHLGRDAARLALRWLLGEKGRSLPQPWLSVVVRHIGALADLVAREPGRPIGSLLMDLGPADRALRTIPPATWLPLREEMKPEGIAFDAFLLSLGLYDAGGDGLPVVQKLFQKTYQKARSLSPRSRGWISAHAPSPAWKVWESVSAQEELRRALARRALDYRWGAHALAEVARREDTRGALATTIRKMSTKPSRELYEAFVKAVTDESDK